MTMMAKAGYRFRWVASYNQLVEKIRIFDDGHDDRALEWLKLELASARKSGPTQNVFYDGLVEKSSAKKNVRLTEIKREGPVVHEVPWEQLQRHTSLLSKNASLEPEAGKWLHVDEKYAVEILKNVAR